MFRGSAESDENEPPNASVNLSRFHAPVTPGDRMSRATRNRLHSSAVVDTATTWTQEASGRSGTLRFSIPKYWSLALCVALALATAACTGSEAGGSPEGLTIRIASPADGATVSVPFDVQLEASVPLADPETGNHHAHLYFDTSTDSPDYDIVYGNTWQVTRPLAPGEHTIIVAMANPDHSPAGPTQEIHITVSGGGGGVNPPASPTDSGIDY
jgi:hypothetical protein